MDWIIGRRPCLWRGPGPIVIGVIAGLITTAAMFSTRLVGDELAAFLFRLSLGG